MCPNRDDLKSAAWRKAQGSIANGECLEIASLAGAVVVRDSADPSGAILQSLSGANTGRPRLSECFGPGHRVCGADGLRVDHGGGRLGVAARGGPGPGRAAR